MDDVIFARAILLLEVAAQRSAALRLTINAASERPFPANGYTGGPRAAVTTNAMQIYNAMLNIHDIMSAHNAPSHIQRHENNVRLN